MTNKPWEKPLKKAWIFLTKGYLKYITIPLMLLIFAASIFSDFRSNLSSIYFSIIDISRTTYSFPDGSEEDVFGEYVIKLKSFNDEITANTELQELISEYTKYYQTEYEKNKDPDQTLIESFHVIRNQDLMGEWWMVIEPPTRNSTKADAVKVVADLLILKAPDKAGVSMTMIDHYLKKPNLEILQYSKTNFAKTYGTIKD